MVCLDIPLVIEHSHLVSDKIKKKGMEPPAHTQVWVFSILVSCCCGQLNLTPNYMVQFCRRGGVGALK